MEPPDGNQSGKSTASRGCDANYVSNGRWPLSSGRASARRPEPVDPLSEGFHELLQEPAYLRERRGLLQELSAQT
jgi:hypothetical protein